MTSVVKNKQQILDHFRCQGSGNCCRCPGYVYVSSGEQQKMADQLGLSLAEFIDRFTKTEKGWRLVASPSFRRSCFLDQNHRCSVYSARPSACRSYPDWPDIWQSDETVIQEAQTCPGLNQALKRLSFL